MMTSSRVSALLILLVIVCGPIPDLQLCPCYLYLKNPPKAGNNRHFMSKYYLRLSMLPAYQTALCVLIPVQCRLRGKCITVNEVQGSGQLINFIQFLDNKRSEEAYIVFQTVKILTTHTCKNLFSCICVKSVQSALSDLLTTSATHGTFSRPSTKRGLILIGLELNTNARVSFEHC